MGHVSKYTSANILKRKQSFQRYPFFIYPNDPLFPHRLGPSRHFCFPIIFTAHQTHRKPNPLDDFHLRLLSRIYAPIIRFFPLVVWQVIRTHHHLVVDVCYIQK